MTFLFIALLIGILGVYALFKFKHEVGQPNMRNLHTWLGMGTICLFGPQVIFVQILSFSAYHSKANPECKGASATHLM